MLLAEVEKEWGAGWDKPDGAAALVGDIGVVVHEVRRDPPGDRDGLDDGPVLQRDEPGVALNAEVCAESGDADRSLGREEGDDIRVERLTLVEGKEEDSGDEAAGAGEDKGRGSDISPAGSNCEDQEGYGGEDEEEGSPVGVVRGHASPPAAHRASR